MPRQQAGREGYLDAGGSTRSRELWECIAADNPHAAVLLDELFSEAATALADHPWLGKPGMITGTRELIPHENYRLVYEVERETLWVLALVHVARQWPPAA